MEVIPIFQKRKSHIVFILSSVLIKPEFLKRSTINFLSFYLGKSGHFINLIILNSTLQQFLSSNMEIMAHWQLKSKYGLLPEAHSVKRGLQSQQGWKIMLALLLVNSLWDYLTLFCKFLSLVTYYYTMNFNYLICQVDKTCFLLKYYVRSGPGTTYFLKSIHGTISKLVLKMKF